MRGAAVYFLAVLVLVAVAGCGGSSTNPTTGGTSTTTYAGVFASGSESGAIRIVVPNATEAIAALQSASSDTATVTGSLRFVGGSTVSLSGRLIRSTGALLITGGNYTFTGIRDGNTISGSYSGPNGSGGFTAEWGGLGTTTRAFLGTFAANSPDPQHGTFDMVITGTTVTVLVYETGQSDPIYFIGTLSGNAISVHDPSSPDTPVATGTLNGTTVSGDYTVPDHTGTWSGTLSQ